MASFIVTGPDGKRYKVTGDNAAGAVAAVKKMTAANLTGADAMRARGLRTDPERQAEIDAQGVADIQAARDEGYVKAHPIASRVEAFNAGVPGIGVWEDDALGLINPAAGEQMRAGREAFARARPGQNLALGITGAVAGTVATAGALKGAPLPASTGGRVLAGGAAGTILGGIEGAGAGRPGERGPSALTGAAMGGAVGAAAPVVAKGFEGLVGYLKGSDVASIASALGISGPAARAVKAALDGDDLGRAAQRIDRGGPNAMLAEAGPATSALASATAASGGRATTIMREGIDNRMAQGAADVKAAMDDAFAPGTAVIPQPPKIGTAYDAAYSKPINYASEEGRRIEALIPRVPKEEWAKARKLIEMDPDVPDQIKRQFLISIEPDGTLKKGTLPSVLELDYVTRSLNDTAKAGDGKGALGGNTNQGRLYGKLAQRIREPLKAAVPEYKQALDFAATEIGIKEARDFGATLLRPATTRAQVVDQLRGAPQAERLAAKAAVREAIDDTLANTRRIMSREGTDVGEAIRAVKDLSTRASRDKLAVVLGPQEAEKLTRKLDEAATAFEIGAALSRNSDTAIRGAVQESVRASAAPGVLGRLLAGEPLGATKRLAQIFTGSSPEAQAAREAGIFEEIATALTQTKGPNARRALVQIQQAMKEQKLTTAKARDLASLTTAVLAGGSYRTGTLALESR